MHHGVFIIYVFCAKRQYTVKAFECRDVSLDHLAVIDLPVVMFLYAFLPITVIFIASPLRHVVIAAFLVFASADSSASHAATAQQRLTDKIAGGLLVGLQKEGVSLTGCS